VAFTETNRVAIRKALGFAAIYIQADPQLENAITAVQSTADGGTRPDSSTETAILAYLTSLAAIDAILESAQGCLGTIQVDDVKMDSARGEAILKGRARRLVGHIGHALSTVPRYDVYSPPPTDPAGGFTVTDQAYNDWPVLAGSRNR
jgi:hypothetical protein